MLLQSDLTYLHTSVLDEIAHNARELDKYEGAVYYSVVYSRIIADLFQYC